MHPVRFPFFYKLLFLPEPVSDAHGIHHFISIDFLPLCMSRLIIKILAFSSFKFFMECLNRIKFVFSHNRGKPLFHIRNLIVDTANLLL